VGLSSAYLGLTIRIFGTWSFPVQVVPVDIGVRRNPFHGWCMLIADNHCSLVWVAVQIDPYVRVVLLHSSGWSSVLRTRSVIVRSNTPQLDVSAKWSSESIATVELWPVAGLYHSGSLRGSIDIDSSPRRETLTSPCGAAERRLGGGVGGVKPTQPVVPHPTRGAQEGMYPPRPGLGLWLAACADYLWGCAEHLVPDAAGGDG
jgi:hypothetical protein